MLYFDAAFIAKFYLQQPESDAVRALAEDSTGVVSLIIGRIDNRQQAEPRELLRPKGSTWKTRLDDAGLAEAIIRMTFAPVIGLD